MDENEHSTTDKLHNCEHQVGIIDRKYAEEEEVVHLYKNDRSTEQAPFGDTCVVNKQLIVKKQLHELFLMLSKLSDDELKEIMKDIQIYIGALQKRLDLKDKEQELENPGDSLQAVLSQNQRKDPHKPQDEEEELKAFGYSSPGVPQYAMKQQDKTQAAGIQNFETSMECSHAASKQDGEQIFMSSMEFNVSPQERQEPEASVNKSRYVPQDSCLRKDEEQHFDVSSDECLQVSMQESNISACCLEDIHHDAEKHPSKSQEEEEDSEASILCPQDNSQQDGQQDAVLSVESLKDVSEQDKEEDSEASIKCLLDIPQQDREKEPENFVDMSTGIDQDAKESSSKKQEERKSPEIEKLDVQNVEKALNGFPNWYQLGIQLKLTKNQVDTIDADNREVARARINMISAWLDNDPDPSWKKLAEALKGMGNPKLSRTILSQHGLADDLDQDQEANLEECPKDVPQNERKYPCQISDGSQIPKDSTECPENIDFQQDGNHISKDFPECPENIGSQQDSEQAAELDDDQQGVMIAQDNQQGDQLNLKIQHCHECEQAAEVCQDVQPLEFYDDHFKEQIESLESSQRGGLEDSMVSEPPPTKFQLPNHKAYHGEISGKDSEDKLHQHGGSCFLLRHSVSLKKYILSVRSSDGNVSHLKLTINQDKPLYAIDNTEKDFKSLNDLINYYKTNPLDHSIRTLGEQCDLESKCVIS